jgi:TolB-like protein/tRNA A-37 threonylcarbamoyl transferase component Bud32/Flp pilus assembly protein TadD
MGEVYRARDTRLDRDVAIKVLPHSIARDPLALERFHREARTVASVSHARICAIYDVGEFEGSPYIVMELLEGRPLYALLGPRAVPVEQLIEWGMQLADGLEAAHARGIIHRDLKPANIVVTPRGDVKVLDFGVAKLVDDQAAQATTMAALTDTGVTVGTTAYMSPEQVRGELLDQRTDLFALGLVLYEIATGHRAFVGTTTGLITDAILNRAPAPVVDLNPALPPTVAAIIDKLLEKDRELRYRQAADVRADLKRALRELHGPPTPPRGTSTQAIAATPKSVAVLPFRNQSPDADNAFFSDGITEDLIDALGRVGGLRVASRASAFRFRDEALDLHAVGAALGVGAIVEGSVRRAGARLRVSAALVDASTGFQIWSERYDREMADVFAIQDEIVSSLVSALAPALLGVAKDVVRRPTDNLEAYEFYLKGRHYWHQRSPSTLRLAIQSFERAIALDNDYALAYAGLADSWALYRPYGWLPIEACYPAARQAVERAMALGPELAEVQFAQALHALYFDRHWRASEPFFKRAIELNPRWSLARVFHGVALAGMYRLGEASVEARAAIELDPLSPFVHGAAGMAYFAGGDVASAEEAARRALELQPDFLMGVWLLAIALDDRGALDEAARLMEQTTALSRAPIFVSMLGKIYALQQRPDDCARIEAELQERRSRGEYIPHACDVMIAVGRRDLVLLRAALAACITEQTCWLTVRMGPGPMLETFRSDPEVNELLDRIYDVSRAT